MSDLRIVVWPGEDTPRFYIVDFSDPATEDGSILGYFHSREEAGSWINRMRRLKKQLKESE